MACQRCGVALPAYARACPTCGLAQAAIPDELDDFASSSQTFTGYLPLFTTLPDGSPGNAPALWLPLPMNVGTPAEPRYSAGIPRERMPTIPLVQNADGTASRIPAVVKRQKPLAPPRASRRMRVLPLVFGLILASLLLAAYMLVVVVGGDSTSSGLQFTAVTASLLASFLAGVGLLANGLSRWSARRRRPGAFLPQLPAES